MNISFSKMWLGLILGFITSSCANDSNHMVSSPDGDLVLQVYTTDENTLAYSVNHNGSPVILESDLGLELTEVDFTKNVEIESRSGISLYTDNYSLTSGKVSEISYSAHEQTLTVANANGHHMDVTFRVSNDGVAYRYTVRDSNITEKQFVSEASSFAFAPESRAWLQPMAQAQTGWSNTNPSYEEYYEVDIPVGTPSALGAGWVFPALFHTGDNWVLISETGMNRDWHASRLHHESANGEYVIDGPQKPEVFTGGPLLAHSDSTLTSPWRIMAIGSLSDIVESTLGTDLANPAVDMDPDFINPGQASWSWAILKDASVVFDVQKRFIDYAADMNWEYTLIDVNWDTNIGYDRLAELVDYAAEKNVGILVWLNSSGDWNVTPYTPKSQLLTHEQRMEVFSRLNNIGVKGVKIDFFSGDGQSMIAYYEDIMQDAADNQLLVNFHGATLPRGWQRTFPNLMTVEAIRGFEFATFEQAGQDRVSMQALMSLFTRNIFDPMDFTPMVFGDIPNIDRQTENSFELALSVLMTSSIQHFAERPQGMATAPQYVREFLRDLPAVWDDIRYLEGYPGDYIVLARRAGDKWYVAGINGATTTQTVPLDLGFIGGKSGYMIGSGESERDFTYEEVSSSEPPEIHMRPNAGFVIVF